MQMTMRMLHHAFDNVYLAQGDAISESMAHEFNCFSTEDLKYAPFCDDFGPMNALSVIEFVQILEQQISRYPKKKIVYCSASDKRALTNAAFLLGSYLILKRKEHPADVWKIFSDICDHFEGYRDATFSEPTFELTLLDCWSGLARGMSMGWIEMSVGEDGLWGNLTADEYKHYDDPLNGDLHIVIPDRFIAFKGPKDLPGGRQYHDQEGYRDFSPDYYVPIFHELNVKAVVRLNEPEYNPSAFESHGIAHHHLEFSDCTAPPWHIVHRFFDIIDATNGAIAIHCKAGLGRTGTLIALDLMRRCGFSAREAIGWLRIMRPGCVIGEQQHYLASIERADAAAAAAAAAAADGDHADDKWSNKDCCRWRSSPASTAAAVPAGACDAGAGGTCSSVEGGQCTGAAGTGAAAAVAAAAAAAMGRGRSAAAAVVAQQVADGMKRRAAGRIKEQY